MSCKVVIKQEEVDVDVDTINITSDSSYGQVIDLTLLGFKYHTNWFSSNSHAALGASTITTISINKSLPITTKEG